MLSRRVFLRASGVAALATGFPGPARASTRWDRLRRALSGPLVLPGEARYPVAKRLAAAQFDSLNPSAIAYCASSRDVQECLRFAAHEGTGFAVRSGGHSFTGWSSGRGLVIDVSGVDSVSVRAGSAGPRTVRIGPGATAVDATAALAPHGLSVASGLCPTVAQGGFVSGGGLGWQTRLVGPASDRVVSARVVLADGRVVRASRHEEPELFWALRGGGGGNFGVVTEFELAPTAVTRVATFSLSWPWDAAQRVIAAWQEWIEHSPPELATGMGVLLNDAATGSAPITVASGAYFGSLEQAEAAVSAFVSAVGVAPIARRVEEMAYDKALMRLFGCADKTTAQCDLVDHNPEATLPRQQYIHHRSRMFSSPWPRSGIEDALAAFDANRRAGQYRWLGMLALGGNANSVPADATAYVHRDASFFSVYSVGLNVPDPNAEERAAATAWVDRGFAAIDPHSTGHTYLNYPDISLPDWRDAYYGANYRRLARAKRHYDPHGLFRLPHAIT
ncbi:FAD-binding oxidoreductase [Actinokineospora diospyrosa]|uniref:FAD/FMN-containing dehydrogenase n=1 Tax=Actinokineospora diospyrosa TaxID=103728 RepID=A0ABT1ILG9_9PSEU|nr:FAD-binding oxidoreductase [Actinokineospora diospyrosa]MCP2273502.1 FAD/FMN-containing dehydrogenase [Actinokineospora diospyrosa]